VREREREREGGGRGRVREDENVDESGMWGVGVIRGKSNSRGGRSVGKARTMKE
jgi:hypothetical protein